MSELDELNEVHTTPAKLAAGWAKAYRDGPRAARFPSDPEATFFPRDMDLIASAIVAKDEEITRLRARVAELEDENEWLRAEVAASAPPRRPRQDRPG